MDWFIAGGKFAAKVGLTVAAKMAVNIVAPGWSSAVDFAEAVYDFSQGDVVGGAVNTVSGIADIITLGLSRYVQELMKGSAKDAVIQTAKQAVMELEKEATKNGGEEFAKGIAKEARKRVGQQVSKEIARGVITESVEEVWKGGTKMTANKIALDFGMKVISSGGRDVVNTVSEVYIEDAIEAGIKQVFKKTAKHSGKTVFSLTKTAAVKAASVELANNSSKFVLKDGIVAVSKGIIRFRAGNSESQVSVDRL